MVFVRRSVSMSKPLRALAGIAALAMGLALAPRPAAAATTVAAQQPAPTQPAPTQPAPMTQPAPAAQPAPAGQPGPMTQPAPAGQPDPMAQPAPAGQPGPTTSSSGPPTTLTPASTTPADPAANDDGLTPAQRKQQASQRKQLQGNSAFQRDGFVAELALGASLCISGTAACSNDGSAAGTLVGRNGPGFGTGVTLGVRFKQYIVVGLAYDFHMLSPRWGYGVAPITADELVYRNALLHNVFGVLRLVIPVSRVDIGLEVAPGYSFQFFNPQEGRLVRQLPLESQATAIQQEFSRGFALKLAPVLSVFVSKRAYLGVRGDVILGLHPTTCYKDAVSLKNICVERSYVDDDRRAPVHTLGLKALVGAVF